MIEKRTASITFSSKHNFLKYKSYLGVHSLPCTNAPPSVFSKVALLVIFRSMCIPTHIPVHQNCVCVLKCQWIKSRCIDPVQSIWQQPSPHQPCTLEILSLLSQGKDWFLERSQTFSAAEWCMISQQCFEPKWISSILYWAQPFSVSLIWSLRHAVWHCWKYC